ncbi:hypothetical protein [Halomonas binhaiensis]|uniref:Uncharacterized protein n=1 Tax=Halomonas binhaiensis TaxID=2562282 RepID=A0A5C1NKE1_9GAMM|nr:hypothetical protein [Halomonas binhaiensis]QEM82279.1 hypothetical protein E4T21_12525 [Halomonas binhaiensis]
MTHPVLRISQLIFNVGFYMVLPFLATHLRDNLVLAGAAVGGVVVLVGNVLVVDLLDDALFPSYAATAPWLVSAAFPAISAIALFVLLRFPLFSTTSASTCFQESVS